MCIFKTHNKLFLKEYHFVWDKICGSSLKEEVYYTNTLGARDVVAPFDIYILIYLLLILKSYNL